MITIKKVASDTELVLEPGQTICEFGEDDYVLDPGEPNAEGFYEFPTGMHYNESVPPKTFQGMLEQKGFHYVAKKKGNYDVELWRLVNPQSIIPGTITLGPTGIFAGGMPITGNVQVSSQIQPADVGTDQPASLGLVDSEVKCPRCMTNCGQAGFDIANDHHRKHSRVVLCMNPQCDFHWVWIRRV